jgi:hypothetical protein
MKHYEFVIIHGQKLKKFDVDQTQKHLYFATKQVAFNTEVFIMFNVCVCINNTFVHMIVW